MMPMRISLLSQGSEAAAQLVEVEPGSRKSAAAARRQPPLLQLMHKLMPRRKQRM